MPFKMMGKSPLAKALVGKQKNLPEGLKAEIKASPAKKMSKNSTFSTKDSSPFKILPIAAKLLAKKAAAKIGAKVAAKGAAKGAAKLGGKMGFKAGDVAGNKKKLGKGLKALGSSKKEEQETEETSSKIQVLGSGLLMKGKKSSPYKMKGKNKKSPLKEVTQKDFDDMSFSDQADYLNNNKDSDISKSISSDIGAYNVENNKVVNSASTSSSTSSSDKSKETKKGKTPNDALANRLVSSIERGGRKSKVRKSTRTAKKASRQEAKQTGNPKAKVSKLGIDPRTGNAFKTAKAKSDYIDNRSSDNSKSNTSTSSTKNNKDLKEVNAKNRADDDNKFNANIKSDVDRNLALAAQESNKKPQSPGVVKKQSKPLETKSFNVDKALNSKGKEIKKSNKSIQKELGKSEKERVSGGKKEIKSLKKQRKKATKQFEKSTDKSKKGGLSNLKKSNVPSSIAKVPVAKRPKLYDDGYEGESKRSRSTVKRELKKVKKNTPREDRRSTTITAESKKAGKPVTVRERLRELRKEKRNSPNKMKKNSPVKNYKKGYYGAK